MRAGSGHNLAYKEGFQAEGWAYLTFSSAIKKVLGATSLERTTRGNLDKLAGVDALATIENRLFPVSLRHRERDYSSFTVSRHLSDNASELGKWLESPKGAIKPYFHIQTSRQGERYRLLVVNVEAFANWARGQELEDFYSAKLGAYEFKLSVLPKEVGLRYWWLKKGG